MKHTHCTIFQLLDSRAGGGIESHVFNLTCWLKRNGYPTEVVFLNNYGRHPLKQQLNAAGITWRTLNGSIRSLIRLLRSDNCLLATHGYKAGILGRLAARMTDTPVVSTFHSGDLGRGKMRFYSRLDHHTAGLADGLICVSEEIRQHLNVPSLLVPNFVDLPEEMAEPGTSIAFVGRLSEEKGPHTFAQIAEPFRKRVPVQIFGDGPMRAELETEFPLLHFHGYCDMAKHWHRIGVLCITSRDEGLPLVALEAMSRGIPVLSFAVGGLPQLLSQALPQCLIPKGNIRAFRYALKTWLEMPANHRELLRLEARQVIRRHYSSDSIAPQILEVYRKAMQAHKRQPLMAGLQHEPE